MLNFDKFILCLFYITWIANEVFPYNINDLYNRSKAIKIFVANEGNINKVLINDEMYEIYFYNHIESENTNHIRKKLNKLFTCINCQFGIWIQDELFKFIELFPVLYNSKFLVFHENIIKIDIQEKEKHLNIIVYFTERLIDILLNYFKIISYDSTIEKDILKSLLTLSLKIDSIIIMINKINNNKNTDEINISNDEIVRLLLDTVHSVQSFIALNCKLPSYNFDNKLMFGYSNLETSKFDMSKFLEDIKPLNLESYDGCSVRNMLLLNIKPLIENVSWRINDKIVFAKLIFENIQQSHELEMIYLFQKYVFNSVMKSLFNHILNLYKTNTFIPSNILKIMRSFFLDVSKGYTNIPNELNECFTVIMNITEDDAYSENHNLVISLKTYSSKLNDIVLEKNFSTDANMPASFVEDELKKYLLHLQAVNHSFKCFIRLLDFFHNEVNIYFLPFAPFTETSETIKNFIEKVIDGKTNPNQITDLAFENNSVNSSEGCNYVICLYSLCFETFFYINYASEADKDTQNFFYYNAKINICYRVPYYLYMHRSHNNFKILYNIISFIQILCKKLFNKHRINKNDLKRFVFVVKIELNKYALKLCGPPMFNFLLFNNTKFSDIGSYHQMHTKIVKFLKQIGIRIRSTAEHKYISFERFFLIYEFSASGLTVYKDIIKLNWKGEMLNIGEIYNHITFGVISPFNLYLFFEIFFKFCIALIYYELDHFNKNVNGQIPKHVCDGLTKVFSEYLVLSFPKEFNKIVLDINLYAELQIHFACQVYNKESLVKKTGQEDAIKTHISIQFQNNGIFVNLRKLKTTITESYEVLEETSIQQNYVTKCQDIMNAINSVSEVMRLMMQVKYAKEYTKMSEIYDFCTQQVQ